MILDILFSFLVKRGYESSFLYVIEGGKED